MAGRVSRIAAATAVVAATGTGAAMIGVGTADAANPLIAEKCGTAMSGHAGQAVMLNTASATGGSGPTVTLGSVPRSGTQTFSMPTSQLGGLVHGLPLLGATLSSLLGGTCDVTVTALNAAPAPVGAASNQGTGSTGSTSGGLLKPVTDLLGNTINGVLGSPSSPATSAPQAPVAGASGGSASGTAGGAASATTTTGPKRHTSQPPAQSRPVGELPFNQVPSIAGLANFSPFGNALSPSALYGNLPFVTSGMFRTNGAGFGDQVPGFSPQFGMLDQNELTGQTGQTGQSSNAADPVQNTGKAEALDRDTGDKGNDVGLPLLVAVLALSGVTATLVRTWVLRRAAS
ncbi:MAG: hypothetical protein ACRDQ5_12380 [Sciscionella sp.]